MTTENEARILVLFAHPAFHKSRVNRVLVQAIRAMEGITFHDLYESYPDFGIDVAKEQELLVAHDVVVFQHPFFWYSTPAILKEWQDLVLQHDWAYGHRGTALRGKTLFSVITTGGSEDAYCSKGQNRFTVRELLARVDALGRRAATIPAEPEVIEADGCSLDLGRLEAVREGAAVTITPREAGILRWLHRHRARAVSRAELLERIWGSSGDLQTRTVDMTIANLRQKIERDPAHPRILLTITGVGYAWGGAEES